MKSRVTPTKDFLSPKTEYKITVSEDKTIIKAAVLYIEDEYDILDFFPQLIQWYVELDLIAHRWKNEIFTPQFGHFGNLKSFIIILSPFAFLRASM